MHYCHKMTTFKTIRIAQNLTFLADVGWGGKNRKENELSIQKTKNGILPTRNSALKTPWRLRFKTAG